MRQCNALFPCLWRNFKPPHDPLDVLLAIGPALRYLDAYDRHRTFCAVADRQHPYRQCAHGPVQLAVRAEEPRPLRAAVRRHRRCPLAPGIPTRSRRICIGWACVPDVTVHQSAPFRHVCRCRRAAEGIGRALSLAMRRRKNSSFAARSCCRGGCRRSTGARH